MKGDFTIANIGNRDGVSTDIQFYLSENGTYAERDSLLKAIKTEKTKFAQRKSVRLNYDPKMAQSATEKYIITIVDNNKLATEIDRASNMVLFEPIQ